MPDRVLPQLINYLFNNSLIIGDDHLMTTLPVDLGDDVSNDLINSLMGSNRQTPNNQGSNPEMWL